MRIAALVLLLSMACLAGCGSGDPFDYVQVTGKVSYEDGSPIPIESMIVTFYPQGDPLDPKTHPRPGTTIFEKGTGGFGSVTSHKPGDGLVRGRHKVTLTGAAGAPLDPRLVPPEYASPETTPLEVDTANAPFDLEVRKP